jgi:hypothetical protein
MRTKEEFDTWFAESGGDPWGYSEEFVRARLRSSIEFVKKHLGGDFAGDLVEVGAFNGDFTVLLQDEFPACRILVNDISEVALAAARSKLQTRSNITFLRCDVIDFRLPAGCFNGPFAVMLFECLYYLPVRERETALERLISELRGPTIFVSGPITGEPYFRDADLVAMLARLGYRLTAAKAFNHLPSFADFKAKIYRVVRPFLRERGQVGRIADSISGWAVDRLPYYRQKFGRQVGYCFVPAPK